MYPSECQPLTKEDGSWLSAQLVTWTRSSNQRTLLRIPVTPYPPGTSYLKPNCRRYSSHSSIIFPLEQSNVRTEVLSVVLIAGPVAPKYTMNTQQAQINSCRSGTILFSVITNLGIQDIGQKDLGFQPRDHLHSTTYGPGPWDTHLQAAGWTPDALNPHRGSTFPFTPGPWRAWELSFHVADRAGLYFSTFKG